MDNKTKIEIHNRVQDFNSYRAARVKSLFNAENGCNFDLEAEIDLSGEWQIGVVVGPSGSGKSSIGKVIFGENLIYDYTKGWATDRPIIDEIAPNGDFNEVTGALANVGLGDVPAWLRPFRVLSNGEQFRAGLARLICEKPEKVVIDEFTSVIDRQIAKIGSQAFQKAWRRTNPNGKVVLLTPHYDILDWVKPDWVFDTAYHEVPFLGKVSHPYGYQQPSKQVIIRTCQRAKNIQYENEKNLIAKVNSQVGTLKGYNCRKLIRNYTDLLPSDAQNIIKERIKMVN